MTIWGTVDMGCSTRRSWYHLEKLETSVFGTAKKVK